MNESDIDVEATKQYFRCGTYHTCIFNMACAGTCKCNCTSFPSTSGSVFRGKKFLSDNSTLDQHDHNFFTNFHHPCIRSIHGITDLPFELIDFIFMKSGFSNYEFGKDFASK